MWFNKKRFWETICDFKSKEIENQRKLTNIEKYLKNEIQKLSDRINIIEGKIIKNKIQYVNVVSNENLSSSNYNKNNFQEDKGVENKSNNVDRTNNLINDGKTKNRYNDWVHVLSKKDTLSVKKNNNRKIITQSNIASKTTNTLNNFSKTRAPTLIGKNDKTNLKGIYKRLHLYTSRWPYDTSADTVKDYVMNMVNDNRKDVEEIPLSFGSMKAYKVINLFSFYEIIYNLDNWPTNVLIKRFNYSYNHHNSNNKNKNVLTQNNENPKNTNTTNKTNANINSNQNQNTAQVSN